MERGRRKVHQDNVFAHHRPTVLQSEIRSVANLDWEFPQKGRLASRARLTCLFS
jgi:hypothetical protein